MFDTPAQPQPSLQGCLLIVGVGLMFMLAAVSAGSSAQRYCARQTSLQAEKHQQEVKPRFWTIGCNQEDLIQFAEKEVLAGMKEGLKPINLNEKPSYLREHPHQGNRPWLAKTHIEARGTVEGVLPLNPPTNALVTLYCPTAQVYVDCLMRSERVLFVPGETVTVRGKARKWSNGSVDLLGVRVMR
ncbi:MAG: hypothetical protein HYZ63_03425 [Candidatus Andersenbacteria bacterium]|nr:hypothetical protein [Candidatus Andersenbacteria bacterium]